MTDNKNLNIWNKLKETDPKYTTSFNVGYSGTAITPTYVYEKMTKVFGQCGVGWCFNILDENNLHLEDGQIMLFVKVSVQTKQGEDWSRPIYGRGGDFIVKKNKNGLKADDEAYKKALTDALTNALKMIGMSADVHMGMFDDVKYVERTKAKSLKEEYKPVKKKLTILNKALCDCVDIDEYNDLREEALELFTELYEGDQDILKDQMRNTKERIDNFQKEKELSGIDDDYMV